MRFVPLALAAAFTTALGAEPSPREMNLDALLGDPVQAIDSEFGQLIRFSYGGDVLQLHEYDGNVLLQGYLAGNPAPYCFMFSKTQEDERVTYTLCSSGSTCEIIDREELGDEPIDERIRSYEHFVARVEQLYRANFWSVRPVEALYRLKQLPIQQFTTKSGKTFLATDGEWGGDLFLLTYTPGDDDAHDLYELVTRLKAPPGLLPHSERFISLPSLDDDLGRLVDIVDSDFGVLNGGPGIILEADAQAFRENADGNWLIINWMLTHAEEPIDSLESQLSAVGRPDQSMAWLDLGVGELECLLNDSSPPLLTSSYFDGVSLDFEYFGATSSCGLVK